MKHLLRSLWKDESGQDLVEYAMLLVLMGVACIIAVTTLGDNIESGMDSAADALIPAP
jgi:Flp pilus assembly pilin Flp